jgi:hypothetical protein
MADKNEIN